VQPHVGLVTFDPRDVRCPSAPDGGGSAVHSSRVRAADKARRIDFTGIAVDTNRSIAAA
jgi:hypothetical protein